MRSLFLDAEHQQELVKAYKTTTDKRLRERIQAVLMTAQGHSQPQIAAALCLCTRTVRRYLRAYQKEGLRNVIERLWKRLRHHATHNRLFTDSTELQRTLGQHFTWLQAHRAEVRFLISAQL